MSVELKPCPFCGGKPSIVKMNGGYDAGRKDNYGNFCISCEKCGIRFQTFVVSLILKDDGEAIITNTKNKAIEAWNRRISDADS